MFGKQTQRCLKEFLKLSGSLFAACLREFAMLDPTVAGDMTADFDIVGRIDKYELGALVRQQNLERFLPARITAKEAVITKNP